MLFRSRTPLRRGGTAMDDFRAGGRAGGEGRAERSQTEQRLPACAGRALARDNVAWAATAPCPPPDLLYLRSSARSRGLTLIRPQRFATYMVISMPKRSLVTLGLGNKPFGTFCKSIGVFC